MHRRPAVPNRRPAPPRAPSAPRIQRPVIAPKAQVRRKLPPQHRGG